MKVVGLRIEKYVGKSVDGHNCDFEYTDGVFDRYVICGVDVNNDKVEIKLYQEEGVCGSGWCTASFGYKEYSYVKHFDNFSHRAIGDVEFPDEDAFSQEEDVKNAVFEVSECGGCQYYPSGFFEVDMSFFKETKRIKEDRPI